jgi:hypothetical protein
LPHFACPHGRYDAERDDLSRYTRLNGSPPSGRDALALFRGLANVSFLVAYDFTPCTISR